MWTKNTTRTNKCNYIPYIQEKSVKSDCEQGNNTTKRGKI